MKAYKKKHVGIAPIAHFIAQPSKYSQRVLSLSLKKMPVRGRLVHFGSTRKLDLENASALAYDKLMNVHFGSTGKLDLEKFPHTRVRYERGRTLKSLSKTRFFGKNKYRILDGLADLVVDHMRLGVVHGDLHAENVIVSKSPLALKAIDYTGSVPLAGRFLGPYVKTYPAWDYHSVRSRLLPAIARDKKELERLKRLFEKRFLEKVEEKL